MNISSSEQSSLVLAAQNGDRRAINKLLAFCERDIRAIVSKMKCGRAQREDLAQEARIAIVRSAIPKFDPTAGKEFRFYAAWWVRTEVRRKHNVGSSVVSRNVRTLAESDVSLDAQYGDEDGDSFLATFVDDAPSPEEALLQADEDAQVQRALESAVTKLLKRKNAQFDKAALCRDVLYSRILAATPTKLDDLAVKHNVARETVRKLEVLIKDEAQEALALAVA